MVWVGCSVSVVVHQHVEDSDDQTTYCYGLSCCRMAVRDVSRHHPGEKQHHHPDITRPTHAVASELLKKAIAVSDEALKKQRSSNLLISDP